MGTTKHTCGGPVFGNKTPGCPRCDELIGGAAPVVWAGSKRKADEQAAMRAIRAHNCQLAKCGVVCTFGEW